MLRRIIKAVLPDSFIKTLRVVQRRIKNMHIDLNDYYLLPRSQITYAYDSLYTFHNADFMKDPLFMESYNLGKMTCEGRILKDYEIYWRIHVLCWAAYHAKHLEGDFVDCGVNTGIFARAIINYIDFQTLNKKYYLMDTFCGLNERYSSQSEMERNEQGLYWNKDELYEKAKRTFSSFNVEIIKGVIPETLQLVKSQKICYLSVDMNCVIPEIEALEFFWDKLSAGAIIVLDDYGHPGFEAQKEAHDKFARKKNVQILSLPTCQGLIIKP